MHVEGRIYISQSSKRLARPFSPLRQAGHAHAQIGTSNTLHTYHNYSEDAKKDVSNKF